MRFIALLITVILSISPVFATTLKVEVDANQLRRGLLEANITIPADGEELVVWFPKWIPGIHGPRGPVENLGGLVFTHPDGRKLEWRRDLTRPYRFVCKVPAGTPEVNVFLRYICNQPSVNSRGVDSYGNFHLGVINWNTCIVYPEGISQEQIKVQLRIKFPGNWKYASALKATATNGDTVEFAAVNLEQFVDSPLICGEHLRSTSLKANDFPPVNLNIVSESAAALQLPQEVIEKYRNLVVEARELFVEAPYKQYEFLVVASDQVPSLGLEHLSSSLNGFGERDLFDERMLKGWVGTLLPHEYVHAWCGKYRRPRGMHTDNLHDDKDTRLLWIYEGLTTYLGEVLAVRAGFLNNEEYLEVLAERVKEFNNRTGRNWRSLEDTAISAHLLRARSRYWHSWRRRQDYYYEGLMFWLEIDARIRLETHGKHSLDDFCQKFFSRREQGREILPYDLAEVIEILNGIASYDWRQLMKERIETPREALSLEFIQKCGYKISYKDSPSKYLEEEQKHNGYIDASDTLGLIFSDQGRVLKIIPGMIGDRAGIVHDTQVIGVNSRKFSQSRLIEALTDSPIKRHVELLLLEGDHYRIVKLDYHDGLRYLHLERDGKRPDIFADILKAKRK